ncbi:MAG: acetate--CoA ligase [Desulfobacterales bacterium]|nr:acetate--CoA ligase [Desulfobacterales bacterium]
MDEYKQLFKRSIEDPEGFWAEQAEKYLSWDKKWDFVLEYDFDEARVEWFGGSVLNASYNCLDRHMETCRDKVAYYWESDSPGETKAVTYSDLFGQVNKFAGVLKSKGIKKGDRVVIYMPRIVELPVAVMACARIGAVHSIVFGGFSAKALANRILDCNAKTVITVDQGYRAGRLLPFKKNVDKALKYCPEVQNVIVFNRSGQKYDLNSPRDTWWHEAMSDPNLPSFVLPEPMDAEDPLFILYTSGTTGPKGLVHTHAGYLLYAAITTRLVFDLKEDEIFWCTADFGWISGHSYGIYGPLLNGLSCVMFEGVLWHPDYDRYWEIVARYRVNKFYSAPSVIRTLAKAGEEHIKKHDISCLTLLGSAGDVLNPEAWKWYYHNVGGDRCPVVDTYWQIETGGSILTPLPGVAPVKPGSCSFPFFGVDVAILDDTGEDTKYPNQEGVLCVRHPWPGIARTIYNDHDQYTDLYFSQIPGMYFTSDGAMRDEDGYYWLTGRIDDVINVSGHRLGTAEIESSLTLHDYVAEAGVVGYPHPVKGQGIYAFVALKTGITGSDDLKKELNEKVRTEIGPIATIDVIQWATALPKTRSGKILRHILDKIAAGRINELGDTSGIADPAVIENLIQEYER